MKSDLVEEETVVQNSGSSLWAGFFGLGFAAVFDWFLGFFFFQRFMLCFFVGLF
jgi:hypothetical protein